MQLAAGQNLVNRGVLREERGTKTETERKGEWERLNEGNTNVTVEGTLVVRGKKHIEYGEWKEEKGYTIRVTMTHIYKGCNCAFGYGTGNGEGKRKR